MVLPANYIDSYSKGLYTRIILPELLNSAAQVVDMDHVRITSSRLRYMTCRIRRCYYNVLRYMSRVEFHHQFPLKIDYCIFLGTG